MDTPLFPGLIVLLASIGLLLVPGYFLPSWRVAPGIRRAMGWFLFLGSTLLVERATGEGHPVYRMLALIAVMLVSLKTLVCIEAFKDTGQQLSFSRWLSFALAWVGMQPALFQKKTAAARQEGPRLLQKGAAGILAGLLLLLLLRFVVPHTMVTGYLLLVGFSLVLHFGLLNVLSGGWRLQGIPAPEGFRSPLKSKSLQEFWGRRWNLAFIEMTALVLYRPMKEKWPPRTASAAAFVFSGLLHEMAISVPVKAGYGLPLLYFLLQAAGVQLESYLQQKEASFQQRPGGRLAWLLLWLLLPLPLLFHQPFLRGIIYPLAGW